jgi:hypothetical protein
MGLAGKKIAVFVEQMFNDQEFCYPYYRMIYLYSCHF